MFSVACANDPHPVYRAVHEQCPVSRADGVVGPSALITKYEDVLWALKHPEVFSSKGVVNIGNDREIRILDAANIIASALGHENVQWQIEPSLPGSTPTRRPDISRLRQIMSSYNPISFQEAIARMLKNR